MTTELTVSENLFLEWRDKFDKYLLTKKGTVNMKRWDKLYNEYDESLSVYNRNVLEGQLMSGEDSFVPEKMDEDDEDEEPMTFEEDMESCLDAFDDSTMKHQIFSYSTENDWPKRDEAHPWPTDTNDLSTLMAIYVVDTIEMDPDDTDTVDEFNKIFTPSGK